MRDMFINTERSTVLALLSRVMSYILVVVNDEWVRAFTDTKMDVLVCVHVELGNNVVLKQEAFRFLRAFVMYHPMRVTVRVVECIKSLACGCCVFFDS